MRDLLDAYPYLFMSIMLFIVFLFLFRISRSLRPLLFLGGAASALYSFTSPIFVPAYWEPVRLGHYFVGLEDMVFSFANGGIACFFAIWPFRNRIKIHYSPGSVFLKYLFWTAFGAFFSYLMKFTGSSVMFCFLFAMLITGAALIFKRSGYWQLSFSGGPPFTILYMGIIFITGLLFPSFHTQWTHENLWGIRLLGFPIEEFIWAFGFGAVFPLIMASGFGLTFENSEGFFKKISLIKIRPVKS